ncbi:Bcr/CflA subfamily drug resistance transporter [Bradyrhizobium sp. F1.13.4]
MSDVNADDWVSSGHRPMGFPEFVIVIASIMALNPLAMDMMLPALPNIGSAFNIPVANHLQLVLSTFLIGFGAGQFVMGPLSDRFGRRPVLLGGMAVYAVASVLAIAAPSFETLLLARALQGFGTSATRVIATSIVRDCYVGRRMASVMSLAMMIFIAVPVIAPSFGQAVLLVTQWRGIFVVLMLYGLLALAWSVLRLPETLPESERRSLAPADVLTAYWQTVTHRQTLGYALAAGSVMGALFAYVFSAQQVFVGIYHLGHYFPLAFAAIAAGTAIAGFLNARFVGTLGMRVISHGALTLYTRGGGRDAADRKPRRVAASPVHGALGTHDVLVRHDGCQLHRTRHGAAGPHRRHCVLALRLDHHADRHRRRHGDRTKLRRHAAAVLGRLLRVVTRRARDRAGGGEGTAVQAASSRHRLRNLAALSMLYRNIREEGEMEQESRFDQPAREIERPAPRQPVSEQQPDRSLPFAGEGLEQLRDSHC